jgi:hypothetical protein
MGSSNAVFLGDVLRIFSGDYDAYIGVHYSTISIAEMSLANHPPNYPSG